MITKNSFTHLICIFLPVGIWCFLRVRNSFIWKKPSDFHMVKIGPLWLVTLKYLSSMLPQIKKITEKFNFLNILFEYFSLIMYNSTPSIDSLLSFHFFSFLVNNIIHTVFLIHDGFPLKIVYNIDIDIINYLIVALFFIQLTD